MSSTIQQHLHPVKDENSAHPIASDWREPIRRVVDAFVNGDYTVTGAISSIVPVEPSTADQVRRYIERYGETLKALPEETWETSVAQWTGAHWDILVDLWTEESGESDMVLSARVFEKDGGFQIVIDSVHVP